MWAPFRIPAFRCLMQLLDRAGDIPLRGQHQPQIQFRAAEVRLDFESPPIFLGRFHQLRLPRQQTTQ